MVQTPFFSHSPIRKERLFLNFFLDSILFFILFNSLLQNLKFCSLPNENARLTIDNQNSRIFLCCSEQTKISSILRNTYWGCIKCYFSLEGINADIVLFGFQKLIISSSQRWKIVDKFSLKTKKRGWRARNNAAFCILATKRFDIIYVMWIG